MNKNTSNHKSVLKEYYGRYLRDVRSLSNSSVKHYFDALNNISRRLKEKNLVREDIYEVADLDTLNNLRDILYSDPDFIELNERGKRMYSAGLNNYCRFAEGQDFGKIKHSVMLLDIPIEPESAIIIEQTVWKRSGILRAQSLEFADYQCELNPHHETFIAESTKKPYMEGHHALPMKLQDHFPVSLDIYANIICLCPVCHRKIHHGLSSERSLMAKQIYDKRSERLVKSGIVLSKEEFVKTTTVLII